MTLIEEFKKCLSAISYSRAGWDFQLLPAQREWEAREEKAALARARQIWADNPALRDDLRTEFAARNPLATMEEIERPA
jgi:hypothetical protein